MVFCNFLEIKAETKKVVGVKVVPFGVLYSCVKFRRLKMGDPIYKALMLLNFCGNRGRGLGARNKTFARNGTSYRSQSGLWDGNDFGSN